MQSSLTTVDLPVLGMTCAACVRRVERAARAVPGVATVDVNLALSRARVELDPAQATPLAAADAIREAGYDVPADALDVRSTGASRLAAIERAAEEDTAALRRDALIAIVLAVPLLALAMTHITATWAIVVQLVVGTVVVLGPGMRYVRHGTTALLAKSPDMNTLIALGALAAWLSSTVVTVRWLAGGAHHAPHVYFEAGAAIVAFVMLGKLLEARARARLTEAMRGVLSLAPATAHLVDGSDVDAATLEPGAQVIVRPGERVPADGTIMEGSSALDESFLTGESLPIDKTEGAPVYAGTLNHHGALTVRVARAGGDTALARIARAVEDAQGEKAPIARLADRVSAVFVPIVLAIALLTLGVWLALGDPATALERAIAVLVIACPCALGLATPAAVALGTARGAELGILFRSGDALERAAGITVVALDKTGTLTEGTPAVVATIGHGRSDADVLRMAAAVERASEHPIARAIVDACPDAPRATEVRAEAGKGITGVVDGARVLVGSRDALALAGADPAPLDAQVPSGATLAYVAIDGALAGVVAIADRAHPAARSAVAALRELAVEPVMITGDRDAVARELADEVGIARIHAGVAPTQKAALVTQLRAGGQVAMVGDGINDAPALATADVGIAMASGTDLAVAAADITLVRGGIGALPTALALARKTLRTIRQNLVAAFAYNVVCIPIAAGVLAPVTGWTLSPVLASAAMSLSSVSVLVSSLRLRRFTA